MDRYYDQCHLTDEEREAQRSWVGFPKPHSKWWKQALSPAVSARYAYVRDHHLRLDMGWASRYRRHFTNPGGGVSSLQGQVGYTEAVRRCGWLAGATWKLLNWTCAFEWAEQGLGVLHGHHPNLPLRWGLATDALPPNRHPWPTHFN